MTTNFHLGDALEILERTPGTLTALLADLSDDWLNQNEGSDTWTPREVVAHMVGGERTDWILRVRHLLEHGERKPFPPFNRTGEIQASGRRPIAELLAEFTAARRDNLGALRAFHLTPVQLEMTSIHPEFGRVHLREHLATWAVHDLTHISQIVRVLARRYSAEVGPWRAYLRVVREPAV